VLRRSRAGRSIPLPRARRRPPIAHSRGNEPARSRPSVRQWIAEAAFPQPRQRKISVASANRASGTVGRPGQFGVRGQASGTCRLCQRDRSALTLNTTSRSFWASQGVMCRVCSPLSAHGCETS
jgi:hypothetical protein